MSKTRLKEEVVGTDPCAEAVELSRLDHGEFEVTLRYLPSRDPDDDRLSQPTLSVRRFHRRAAAEARYEDVLEWLRSLVQSDGGTP